VLFVNSPRSVANFVGGQLRNQFCAVWAKKRKSVANSRISIIACRLLLKCVCAGLFESISRKGGKKEWHKEEGRKQKQKKTATANIIIFAMHST